MAGRERLTHETLGMRKWRGNDAEADYDGPMEENTTHNRNPSL